MTHRVVRGVLFLLMLLASTAEANDLTIQDADPCLTWDAVSGNDFEACTSGSEWRLSDASDLYTIFKFDSQNRLQFHATDASGMVFD